MPVTDQFSLLEQLPFAVFGLDPESLTFSYVNPAFASFFETPEVSENTIWQKITEQDREYLKRSLEDLLNDSIIKDIEIRLMRDDQPASIRIIPFVVNTDNKKLVFGMVFDITSEVENIGSYIKYANKKNSILYMLGHDLSGHLAVTNTAAALLERKIDDPQLKTLISTISGTTEQAIFLIKDLTKREFLETADVQLVKKRIDIVTKLKDYIEEAQRAELLTRRTFNFSSSHESIFITLDEAKFIQVVNNLVSNALKFTRPDGIISISVEDERDSVIFSIADDGIGIPEQFHSSIFEKFTEAGRKGLQDEPTRGLGLSVVKTIVNWHQGEIWFKSRENAGTTFFIRIPRNV